MYESFFAFSARPFVAAPATDCYFPAAVIDQARETLARAIDRAEGPGLLIGAPGVGKTLLCRMLAEHFRSTLEVVHLSSTRIPSCKDLLQNILFELKQPFRESEEGVLRLSLLDYLQPDRCPGGLLLLVDEAHELTLPSLDELLMLTNFVREGSPRVRLVLSGGTTLEERFATPKLESFNQRIAARAYLEPFTRDETMQYIRARVAAVGGTRDPFQDDALSAVFHATDGIPRLINQVCDHALVLACVAETPTIGATQIEESWADLQQLPGPWQGSATTDSPEGGVVEFGQLDSSVPTSVEAPSAAAVEETVSASDEASSQTPMPAATTPSSIYGSVAGDPAPYDSFPAVQATGGAATSDPPLAIANLEETVSVPRTPDPFGTGFDDEEVVIDRSAALESDLFRGRPEVVSEEGRQLAQAMFDTPTIETASVEPAENTVPESVASVWNGAEEDQPAVTSEVASHPADELPSEGSNTGTSFEDAAAEAAPSFPQELVRNEDPSTPAAVEPESGDYVIPEFECNVFDTAALANQSLQALCEIDSAIVGLSGGEEEQAAVGEEVESPISVAHPASVPDDRDMLVIEDDVDGSHDVSAQAQRLDYQELFTQLRRGT